MTPGPIPTICCTLLLLISATAAWAQDDSQAMAEELMHFQLQALRDADHDRFLAHGNNAFTMIMDEFTFESLVMQRKADLAKGYELDYLGAIHRIGMWEHLWRVHPTGDTYQLLGRLSLSHGKVVGFGLE